MVPRESGAIPGGKVGVQMGRKIGYGSMLFQKGNVYYFRQSLTDLHKQNLGISQIKKSLGVREIRTARKLVPHLQVAIESFTLNLQQGRFSAMDNKQRRLILFQDLETRIDTWRLEHAQGKALTKPQLNKKIEEAQKKAVEAKEAIQLSNLKPALEEAKKVLSLKGVDESEISKDDAYTFSKYQEAFHKYVAETLSGNFSRADNIIKRIRPEEYIPIIQGEKASVTPDSPLISDLINKYILENSGVWSKKTAQNNVPTLRNIFLGSIEDKPLSQFTREDFNKVRDVFASMDSRKRPGQKLTRQRVNGILSIVRSFFTWSVKLGYMEVNFASNSAVKIPKSESTTRDIFEPEDLLKIFEYKTFQKPIKSKILHYWLPIVALYTGARLGELCYLKKEDIINKETHWIINIHDKHHPVKTETSIREIPIHPDLIKIGFLKYVDSIQDDEFIFYTRDKKPRIAETASRFFTRMKQELGFAEKKTFHSFRHTFANICKQKMLPEIMCKEVLGHKVKDITFGHYAKKYESQILFDEVVSKMEFPIDLPAMLQPWEKIAKKIAPKPPKEKRPVGRPRRK